MHWLKHMRANPQALHPRAEQRLAEATVIPQQQHHHRRHHGWAMDALLSNAVDHGRHTALGTDALLSNALGHGRH